VECCRAAPASVAVAEVVVLAEGGVLMRDRARAMSERGIGCGATRLEGVPEEAWYAACTKSSWRRSSRRRSESSGSRSPVHPPSPWRLRHRDATVDLGDARGESAAGSGSEATGPGMTRRDVHWRGNRGCNCHRSTSCLRCSRERSFLIE
jgi:hypothetical protein